MAKVDSASQTLQKIHAKWMAKCTCKLRKTATRAVPGSGSSAADIVFIGEAPGKKEDLTGLPFVGAAGKFLDEMLATVKLDRKDVYITSIVKYRPPNNRDPFPEEIRSCAGWLRDELTFIQPKLIVFLGRHAMHQFFPDLKISEVHGTHIEQKIPNFPTEHFFALYHPAAALYNGSMRELLFSDFKKIPSILRKLK